jgi:chemotaxis protein methyltransferase CheR
VSSSTLAQPEFQLVCDLVLRRSGIVLEAGKEYLVEARLAMLAKRLNVAVPQLITKLRMRDDATERSLIDAMTTNETSFFRDVKPFETFKKTLMPALIAARAAEKRLSFWCAASSTGQEPYAIAMLLREHFPQLADWKLSFVASDLSRDVLEKARAGRYSQTDVNRGLPATLLVKYFRKVETEWEVVPEVRKMIDFREVNLLATWPVLPPLDICFIRNVLIYFSPDTKRQILGKIRKMMRPDGYLFLGAAETTLNVDESFKRLKGADDSGCFHLAAAAGATPATATTIGSSPTIAGTIAKPASKLAA